MKYMTSIPISTPNIVRILIHLLFTFLIPDINSVSAIYINEPATYKEEHILTPLLRDPRASPKPAPHNKIQLKLIIK